GRQRRPRSGDGQNPEAVLRAGPGHRARRLRLADAGGRSRGGVAVGSRTLMSKMSAAEFDALPEREGWKVELSAGELVMTASPRAFHNTIRDNLGMSLGNYAKANRIGTVIWELEFKLDDATVRIPDLAFVARERWAQTDKTRLAEVVPDLAIEVVSPSNTASDLALKIQQYLRAGTQIV